MVEVATVATLFIKVLKVVINLIVLILYRVGNEGKFLGVGGTWNLNEDKNPDAEIVASGVLVGFLIYTLVVISTFCFGTTKDKSNMTDVLMNFIGTFLFIAVGGTALHYWSGYISDHWYKSESSEKQIGIAVGSMCVLNGALYLIDTVLSFMHFSKSS